MAEISIKSAQRVVPMIYAYTTPGVPYHEGWTKIGYTERQKPVDRIREQTHTADSRPQLEWQENAIYKDGTGQYFTDHDFHSYLQRNKIERRIDTEWFKVEARESHEMFDRFAMRLSEDGGDKREYKLRNEQEEAVSKTREYFEKGGKDFLWNAKPRFGKTLSAYDLVQRMDMTNVLIVTNRPSIANSWSDDFFKFVYWRGEYEFVTETEALKSEIRAISRTEYLRRLVDNDSEKRMIAFVSLQDLKGSKYFGGDIDKLKWIAKGNSDDPFVFDLLIVDESQEGVDTILTERAFNNINRKHTLYLSGTPFKALADGRFSSEQIFNWSYSDEQEAKQNWDNAEVNNPYEDLPRLSMFTYQISPMIADTIKAGIELGDDSENAEFAFDLNEFFATNETGRFIHEKEVKSFLRTLSTNEKYPYSTPELRKEMSHTLWLLNRIPSARALAKLLKEDPVFSEYTVVTAYGSGLTEVDTESDPDQTEKNSFDRVKKAISENDKTITLSVGQLTVGVTVPEWSGILMLCNLQSASSYMQAAFRVQNPCLFSRDNSEWRKETAYVFDFDPARTLILYDEFANNLSAATSGGKGTDEERNNNIKRLLNFFPVIGEDPDGKMVELDAEKVLSIPRRLKSTEVVNRGFMCNYLFQNISNVFGGSAAVREILGKLSTERVGQKVKDGKSIEKIKDVNLGEDGEVVVPEETVIGTSKDIFGDKIYENINEGIGDIRKINPVNSSGNASGDNKLADTIINSLEENVMKPAFDAYNPKKSVRNRIQTETQSEVRKAVEEVLEDYDNRIKDLNEERDRALIDADTDFQAKEAESNFKEDAARALEEMFKKAQEKTAEIVNHIPDEIVEKLERNKKEEERHTIEDDIRAHLRGFSRTIPSFLMAYGNENTTLKNFDDYTEDDVFLEVTGITEDEFRFLRDGGDKENPETGEIEHFDGHLFDEIVFNDSVKMFMEKRDKLANYFDESLEEDIFDYIPPQKTNQIYTPKKVVVQMVDLLEDNNPGCFDDDTKTFADLYMKSGLYITEIVKRLYSSEKMKGLHPDPEERIRHIIMKQVYGMAPTKIIYLIATNYILGFDKSLKLETRNFVHEDASLAAKEGRLKEVVKKHFGDMVDFD
ncbi:MAG: DEAD/DEAH box helicase family protein [Clostridia bacterium]|nr:DEAD/DEAH box helicase family protein [Clostridia bacterium]